MNVKSKWKLRAKRQKTKQLHLLKWQNDHGIPHEYEWPGAKMHKGTNEIDRETHRKRERERAKEEKEKKVFQTKTDNNHNRKNQWNEKIPFIFGIAFLCICWCLWFSVVKNIIFFFSFFVWLSILCALRYVCWFVSVFFFFFRWTSKNCVRFRKLNRNWWRFAWAVLPIISGHLMRLGDSHHQFDGMTLIEMNLQAMKLFFLLSFYLSTGLTTIDGGWWLTEWMTTTISHHQRFICLWRSSHTFRHIFDLNLWYLIVVFVVCAIFPPCFCIGNGSGFLFIYLYYSMAHTIPGKWQ